MIDLLESLDSIVPELTEQMYADSNATEVANMCMYTLNNIYHPNFDSIPDLHKEILKVGCVSILWAALSQPCKHSLDLGDCALCRRIIEAVNIEL